MYIFPDEIIFLVYKRDIFSFFFPPVKGNFFLLSLSQSVGTLAQIVDFLFGSLGGILTM